MSFDVTDAQHIEGYRIQLSFRDGSAGVVDLASYASRKDVFRAFRDSEYFLKFRVEYGTLVWGEGEVDIAPETLYEKATGKAVDLGRERARA